MRARLYVLDNVVQVRGQSSYSVYYRLLAAYDVEKPIEAIRRCIEYITFTYVYLYTDTTIYRGPQPVSAHTTPPPGGKPSSEWEFSYILCRTAHRGRDSGCTKRRIGGRCDAHRQPTVAFSREPSTDVYFSDFCVWPCDAHFHACLLICMYLISCLPLTTVTQVPQYCFVFLYSPKSARVPHRRTFSGDNSAFNGIRLDHGPIATELTEKWLVDALSCGRSA